MRKGHYAEPDAVYDDSGVSGAIACMDRPAFAAMMSVLLPGDTVIVYSISRLGRTASDTLSVIEEFKRKNIGLVSHTEGFDVTKPVGKLVVTILAGVAEMEREVLRERVKAGMDRAKADGIHCGRSMSDAGVLARDLLSQGVPPSEVILKSGLSKAMVYRLKKEMTV